MLALDFLRRIGACSLIVALSTAAVHAEDKPAAKKEQPAAAEKAAKPETEKPATKKPDAKQADAKKPEGKKKPAAKVSREDVSGKKWDEPKIVTPGENGGPPSDAIVLFEGKNLDEWVNTRDKSPAGWTVADGVLTVNKRAGNIETKRTFRSYQLHVEWLIPTHITGDGQSRGNSGVFLASTGPGDAGYEIQVLDSFGNKTYVNGQAGSIYKQHIPLVNASRKPGEWQSYDISWTASVWNADGSLKSPAYITAFHNGVLIQNHVELAGETVYIGKPAYKQYDRAPIKLQAHGDPSPAISFRNIWVRELK